MKTASYELYVCEQIDNDLKCSSCEVKLSVNPFQLYLKVISPDSGTEVLYTGLEKKALVNPSSFPFINMYLDPYGKLMRRGQHHTIMNSGFSNFKSIIEKFLPLISKNIERSLFLLGDSEINGRIYTHIRILNPEFKKLKYIIKEGETIQSVSDSLGLNAYWIFKENRLKDLFSTNIGDEIVIPNSYAERVDIWIDKETGLPLIQKVYFNEELYEHYEFRNIKINKKFSSLEFSPDYDDYGF